MITRPDNFAAFQMAIDAERHIIVSVTDGAVTWLLSDIDMQLSDGHVYPLLDNLAYSGISSGIDIYSKTWDMTPISLTFHNAAYKVNTSGEWVRLSDEWSTLQQASCDIYLVAGSGSNIGSLSDCLKIFSGYIMTAPQYGIESISIRAEYYGQIKDRELPQRTIAEVYGDYASTSPTIAENMTELMPLVWGIFTERDSSNGDMFNGDGLARCPAWLGGTKYEYVVADHVCYTADESILIYNNVGFMVPVEASSTTDESTLKSGRYVRTVKLNNHTYHKYFYLNGNPPTDYNDAAYLPQNPANIYDGDYTTKADVRDNLGDSISTATQTGLGCFGITNSEAFVDMLTTAEPPYGKYGQITPAAPCYFYVKDLVWDSSDSFNHANDTCEFRLYYSRDGGSDHYCGTAPFDASDSDFDSDNSWVLVGSDLFYDAGEASPLYFAHELLTTPMIGLYAINDSSADSDGTVNNDAIVSVGEARLKIQCTCQHQFIAWAQVTGREFGSWIDNGGRSNSFNEGDIISHPNYIIESMLREEANVPTSQIDESSFDTAYNSSVGSRMNLGSDNKMTMMDAIRQLSEQSTFAFVWLPTGKARLIPLNDDTPTTATRGSHPVKFPYSHIENGNITVSLTTEIVNKMYLSSRWQGEYGAYKDYDVVENSTSQTNYGVRLYHAQWPNICGTAATHVANHLVANATGIWSNAHLQIEFNALGFTAADIEVGDWIELDATTVDPHIKAFGESWSGKQFLVVGINHQLDYTTIKGIELYG